MLPENTKNEVKNKISEIKNNSVDNKLHRLYLCLG